MKKKLVATLALTVSAIMLFAGCTSSSTKTQAPAAETKTEAPAEAKKALKIAGIYKAGDQSWFIDEGKATETRLKELDPSIEWIYMDAKMNPETYLQLLDNVIAQKVDGVVICIPDQKLSQVTVDKLKEANIPVIAADDPLQDESGKLLAPVMSLDAYKLGAVIGEHVANVVKENGHDQATDVGVLLVTMDTVSSCVPRIDGEYDKFTEMIPGFDKAKILRADTNGTTEKGFEAASAVITANPAIKKWYVMGANDESVIGAARALEQAGIDKDAYAVGLGAYMAKDEFKKEYSCVKAAAYFSAADCGRPIADLMYNHIVKGEAIPEKSIFTGQIVTKDNYKEIMGKEAE